MKCTMAAQPVFCRNDLIYYLDASATSLEIRDLNGQVAGERVTLPREEGYRPLQPMDVTMYQVSWKVGLRVGTMVVMEIFPNQRKKNTFWCWASLLWRMHLCTSTVGQIQDGFLQLAVKLAVQQKTSFQVSSQRSFCSIFHQLHFALWLITIKSRRESRILVRGASGFLTPRGGPEPKNCSK